MRTQKRTNSLAAEVRRLRAEVVRLKAELKSANHRPKYTRYEDLPPPHPDDIKAYRERLKKILARFARPDPPVAPNENIETDAENIS